MIIKWLKEQITDAVLVHVNKIKGLQEAYPNYFADTKEFLAEIKIIIDN